MNILCAENANKAREKLELGIHNRAMPLDVLHEARDRLEKRLMRDTMMLKPEDGSDHEELDMDQSADEQEPASVSEWSTARRPRPATRRPIGRLRGLGDASEAPMIRKAFETPLGPLRGLPQSTPQASFQVYVDNDTPRQQPSTSRPTEKRLADEFAEDPDYQVSSGFHLSTS